MVELFKEKESDIQNAILDYLQYRKNCGKDYVFWRQNNTAIFDPGIGGGFRRMPKYGRKGTPDIFLMVLGKVIFLEVKTKIGELSKEQKELKNDCFRLKIDYYVVRGIDDVKNLGL